MKIKVKFYLSSIGLTGERIAVTKEDITLKDFLIQLSNKYNKKMKESFFDFTGGKLRPGYVVLYNGKHLWDLPNKINTKLNDEDLITIFSAFSGG